MALSDNLISYWKLDEADGSTGHTAYDAVNYPSGNNGAFTDVTQSSTNGKLPTGSPIGAGFNGTTSKIVLGTAIAMPTDLTISAWIKTTGDANQVIFSDNKADGSVYYFLWMNNADRLGLYWQSAAGNNRSYLTDGSVTTDTNFHLVTITQVGTGAPIFYFDGQVVASSETGSTGVATKPTAQGTAIGRNGLVSEFYWNGSIDEVGIWSRALTSGEVTSLWNGGAGLAYPLTTNLSISLIDSVTISEYKNINVTQTFYVTNPSTAWGLKIIG